MPMWRTPSTRQGRGWRPLGRVLQRDSPAGREGCWLRKRKAQRSSQLARSAQAAADASAKSLTALARRICRAWRPVASQALDEGALAAPALTAMALRQAWRWLMAVQREWWGKPPSRLARAREATARPAPVVRRPSRRRSWRKEWRNQLLRSAPCRWWVPVASGDKRRCWRAVQPNSRLLARGGRTGRSRPQRRRRH